MCAIIAFFLDIDLLSNMSSIGTLLAFTIVASCTMIIRYTDPPKGTDDEDTGNPKQKNIGVSENSPVSPYKPLDIAEDATEDDRKGWTHIRQKYDEFRKNHLAGISPVLLTSLVVFFTLCTAVSFAYNLPIGLSIVFVLITAVPSILLFFLDSKNIPTTFKCPWMPLIPLLSIYFNIYMMVYLHWATWCRLVGWMAVGLCVYFGYSVRHSNLRPTNFLGPE